MSDYHAKAHRDLERAAEQAHTEPFDEPGFELETDSPTAIRWEKCFDDNDQEYWEGASPYCSDSDPCSVPDIMWRLRKNVGDCWFEDHDAELMGDKENPAMWSSIKNAKAAVQRDHDAIIEAEQQAVDQIVVGFEPKQVPEMYTDEELRTIAGSIQQIVERYDLALWCSDDGPAIMQRIRADTQIEGHPICTVDGGKISHFQRSDGAR